MISSEAEHPQPSPDIIPRHPMIEMLREAVLIQAERLVVAAKNFESVLIIDPDADEAINQLGQAHELQVNLLARAIQNYRATRDIQGIA